MSTAQVCRSHSSWGRLCPRRFFARCLSVGEREHTACQFGHGITATGTRLGASDERIRFAARSRSMSAITFNGYGPRPEAARALSS